MNRDRHHRAWVAALGIGCAIATVLLVLGLPRARTDLPAEHGPFVVAFELGADRHEDFVWPHPTFPPASYARVLLVADQMPRVRTGGGAGPSLALAASQSLRINGLLREPRRSSSRSPGQQAGAPEAFVIDLEAGRLRVAVVLPAGAEVDPQHASAHITLYETELRPRGKPAAREVLPASR